MPEALPATPVPPSEHHTGEAPCHCATDLDEVQAAWGLVYRRYAELGLIERNPFGIHVAPDAVGPGTCVVLGPGKSEVGYTVTLVPDGPRRLALDAVYGRELDVLRARGRRLLEVGMLADRRHDGARGIAALVSMLRWALHYALRIGSTDLVIGVHPRHATFYARYYGFEQFGGVADYPLVRDRPVLPLRLRIRERLDEPAPARGLAQAYARKVPPASFVWRFTFAPAELHGSRIAAFMRARYGLAIASMPAISASASGTRESHPPLAA